MTMTSTPFEFIASVRKSISVYPATMVYTAGVVVAIGIAAEWWGLNTGLLALSIIALMVILVSVGREVKIVHKLVNSQRDELLRRINDLTTLLQDAGIALPAAEVVGVPLESVPLLSTQVAGKEQVYDVRIYPVGEGGFCTCPVWKYNVGTAPRRRTCKHIEEVLESNPNIFGGPDPGPMTA